MLYRKKYSGTDRPRKMETPTIKRLRMEFMLVNCKKESPTAATSPNKTQYTAAKMVNGMEANNAPNFPAPDGKRRIQEN